MAQTANIEVLQGPFEYDDIDSDEEAVEVSGLHSTSTLTLTDQGDECIAAQLSQETV